VPPDRSATKPHFREIDRDCAQPSAEPVRITQLREAEKCAQERLLHDLFRIVDGQHARDDSFDAAAMSRYKRCERVRISGKRRLDELALASHA
jgi:hypothetical protein